MPGKTHTSGGSLTPDMSRREGYHCLTGVLETEYMSRARKASRAILKHDRPRMELKSARVSTFGAHPVMFAADTTAVVECTLSLHI
jgi:rhamnogalacturonyl hydrolase YesR